MVCSDSENEAELVFLSPEEEPEPCKNDKKASTEDQGASPVLRRSNRKRKSVSFVQDMSKGSGSKKKKTSPPKKQPPSQEADQASSMPKLPRTPQGAGSGTGGGTGGGTADPPDADRDKGEKQTGPDFAALLLAMEDRLATKMDATNKAVNQAVSLSKMNSDALETLEEKVGATDAALKETLARIEAQEERVLARVEGQVQEMVRDQLKAAGFDSQLSAGDLSTIQEPRSSYAAAAANCNSTINSGGGSTRGPTLTKEDRQEVKFWECRRSLRLWPVKETTMNGLKDFLTNRLGMDGSFVDEEIGPVTIKRNMERRPKNQHEVCVTFDNKQVRDMVKAQAPNLAAQEEAGMHLHLSLIHI